MRWPGRSRDGPTIRTPWQGLVLNFRWKSAGDKNGDGCRIGFRRTRDLPECRLRAQVVAPDGGPQAHRAALLDVDYLLLLYWWSLRAAHPPGVADRSEEHTSELQSLR